MSNNSFFALIARMRHIRRWGLMRNSYEENLQEHSQLCAVIAHALAIIRRDIFALPAEPDKTAVVALFHDSAEIITGDLPTPVKYKNPDITDAYKYVEKLAADAITQLLPEPMKAAYQNLISCDDPSVIELVKAADKICAYIKCIEERMAGNTEFRAAEKQIKQFLDSLSLPEVAYFMHAFIPAFGLTLDELTE